jgi:hypothetical protein
MEKNMRRMPRAAQSEMAALGPTGDFYTPFGRGMIVAFSTNSRFSTAKVAGSSPLHLKKTYIHQHGEV